MGAAQRIVIPYTPRHQFLPYHEASQRFTLTVAHRRAGKTVARINRLIRSAAACQRQDPRFGYLAPYWVQAKEIAWNYLKHYSAPILRLPGSKVNESELSVTFGHNGATVRLYGAENAERLRGLYFDGLAADEAQDIAPRVLTQIVLPALADRQGWLDLSGTPKGWANLLGTSYKRALEDSDWFLQVLKASETGIIPESELILQRRLMPENEYQQEYECSFDAAITGAYYARELTEADREGRITGVPYDRAARVVTAWDLGMADSTTIWFAQVVGREIRIIDYYEAAGQGLDHYARVLQERGYLYDKHYGPHDLAVREMGTGKSRIEVAGSLGIRFETVANLPVADGRDAVRMMIPRMWFDRVKCAEGIDALRQHREKFDDKRGIALGPLHDWTSHAADAMRYLCVAINERSRTVRRRDEDEDAYGFAGGWMA